jgi:mannose-6-phosphate isomerase-like protein (cupin superfamily)
MIIRDIKKLDRFLSGDGVLLREILHGSKDNLEIGYSLAHALVAPGQSSLPHRLKTSEVYYVISGKGRMRVDDETRDVDRGQAVYIPPGAVQSIENTGRSDLEFLCIVSPAWRPEDEEIL